MHHPIQVKLLIVIIILSIIKTGFYAPLPPQNTQKNTLTHKDNNKNNIILIDDVQVVLSSAFSPTHWLLATGCLSGRLVWHQPVI